MVHDAIRDVLLARNAPAYVAAVLRHLGVVSEEVCMRWPQRRLASSTLGAFSVVYEVRL